MCYTTHSLQRLQVPLQTHFLYRKPHPTTTTTTAPAAAAATTPTTTTIPTTTTATTTTTTTTTTKENYSLKMLISSYLALSMFLTLIVHTTIAVLL